MPTARNQRPTTIDNQQHQRYDALSASAGRLTTMALMQRAAHNLCSDTLNIRQRVLVKYHSRGIDLSESDPVRRLLHAEFYRNELTMAVQDNK